jgi:hypothetical protein
MNPTVLLGLSSIKNKTITNYFRNNNNYQNYYFYFNNNNYYYNSYFYFDNYFYSYR